MFLIVSLLTKKSLLTDPCRKLSEWATPFLTVGILGKNSNFKIFSFTGNIIHLTHLFLHEKNDSTVCCLLKPSWGQYWTTPIFGQKLQFHRQDYKPNPILQSGNFGQNFALAFFSQSLSPISYIYNPWRPSASVLKSTYSLYLGKTLSLPLTVLMKLLK